MEKLGKGDIKFLAKMTLTVVSICIMTCWLVQYFVILSNQFDGINL